MGKPQIEIENGKVVITAELDKKADNDGDGAPAAEIEVTAKAKIDLYELINEISKKDSALLAAVLSQLNYKKA